MPRGCKICRFFEKPYRKSEQMTFEKLAREGCSLRKLEIFFLALNFKANKDSINKHIKVCMGVDVSTQRIIEKDIKREGIRGIPRRVKEFFIRPTEIIPKGCPHSVTIPFYDVASEQVYARCQRCGEVLKGSIDPHEIEKRKKKDPRNKILYWSLSRRR